MAVSTTFLIQSWHTIQFAFGDNKVPAGKAFAFSFKGIILDISHGFPDSTMTIEKPASRVFPFQHCDGKATGVLDQLHFALKGAFSLSSCRIPIGFPKAKASNCKRTA